MTSNFRVEEYAKHDLPAACFILVSCLANSWLTLKMVIFSSRISDDFDYMALYLRRRNFSYSPL
jgi:hypothetical protein